MSKDLSYPEKLKSIRDRLGCSQLEFAQQIKVSFPTVRNWEQSSRGLPSPSARALIDVFYGHPDLAMHLLQSVRITQKTKVET